MMHLLTSVRRTLSLASCLLALGATAFAAEPAVKTFDLPAGPAAETLKQFAVQSSREIVFAPQAVAKVTTQAVKGELTPAAALDAMLADTELIATQDQKTGAFAVRKGERPNVSRAAQVANSDRPEGLTNSKDEVVRLDRFEVVGTRHKPFTDVNADLPRTVNDAQAYYILDAKTIEQSGATSMEDFLRKRLTMSASSFTGSQQAAAYWGSRSSINLNGLGADQTLILINGRRAAGFAFNGSAGDSFSGGQPDLNGIPMGAVERIEVLPSSASAIYGGNAVGGVINVVLKRNYNGGELKLTFDNTFDTDAAIKTVDLSYGLSLEGGRTNLMLAASWSKANALAFQDRDFVQTARAQIAANAPDTVFPPGTLTPPFVGSTANISSSNGSPLFGPGTPSFTYVPVGYDGSGTLSQRLAVLATNAGKYNFALPPIAGAASGGGLSSLAAPSTKKSFMASLRRQMTKKIDLTVEIQDSSSESNAATNPFSNDSFTLSATAPNNPFGQAVRVRVPLYSQSAPAVFQSLTETVRINAGVVVKLPYDWLMQADYTWNRTRSQAVVPTSGPGPNGTFIFSVVGNGTLDVLKDTLAHPLDTQLQPFFANLHGSFDSTLKDAAARFFGPILFLPAGPINVVVGLEHRKEGRPDADYFRDVVTKPDQVTHSYGKTQTANNAYVELLIPVFSDVNSKPGLRLLDLQLAARRDEYSVGTGTDSITYNPAVGPTTTQIAALFSSKAKYDSTNPTVGLRYQPVKDVLLRATFTKGFRPPLYTQLASSPFPSNSSITDPRRGGAAYSVPTYRVQNATLQPETSETRSAGIVLTPRAVKGLRIAADYIKIEKRDEIVSLSAQNIVTNESLYSDRIVRGPIPVGDFFNAGPITQVNNGNINITKSIYESINFTADYRKPTTSFGTWTAYAMATRALHAQRQDTLGAPLIEYVGKPQNGSGDSALKLNVSAGLTWELRHWTAGWNARYYDSYAVFDEFGNFVRQNGGPTIPSQTYHDAFVSYRFATASTDSNRLRAAIGNATLQVGVRNIFDHHPPFIAAFSTSFYSGYGDARLRTYVISFKKEF